MEQLAMSLLPERKPMCIWRELWHGLPFCYLHQSFRLPCPDCAEKDANYREFLAERCEKEG